MKNFIKKIETLDNIRQWEERDSVIKESVSQHSFKVSAIANYILSQMSSVCVDTERLYVTFVDFSYRVLSCAIMHDFDEAILGRDISHVVKYNQFNGKEIRKCIDAFVDNEMTKDEKLSKTYHDYEEHIKTFVKLCDWIALLTFIVRNKSMGVTTFHNEENYCIEKIQESAKNVKEKLWFLIQDKFDIEEFIKQELL